MKTNNLVLFWAFVLVFINVISQEITETNISSIDIHNQSVYSVNRTYALSSFYTSGSTDGKSVLLGENGGVLHTYLLEAGGGGNDGVQTYSSAVSADGDSYTLYQYGYNGDTELVRIQKNYFGGNTTEMIMELEGATPQISKVINGNLYYIIAGGNYGFTGNAQLPALNPEERILVASNGTPDNVLWYTYETEGSVDIELMSNGNLAVTRHYGNLVEYDISNGNLIGTIMEKPTGTVYQKGGLEYFDPVERVWRKTENGQTVYQTDMPNPIQNCFQTSPQNWVETGDGHYCYTSGANYFCTSGKIIHGEKNELPSSYGDVLKSWANSDGNYSFIVQNGNATNFVKLIPEAYPEAILNVLGGDSNVFEVRNGQVYENGNWLNGFHENTVVVYNKPSAGTTPNPNWMLTPTGLTLIGFTNIENLIRNGISQLVYNAIFRETATGYNHIIYMRIYIKSTTEVVGVDDLVLKDFSIYPNPANEYLNLSSSETISEVQIFDTQCRKIFVENTNGLDRVFIGDLPEGMYFVKVKYEGKIGIKKFVKT